MTYAMRSPLVLLILASPHIGSAQTVDEVIEKSVAAIGGRAAFDKVKTRVMSVLYGVMSYNVTRRSREIGIRMAPAARRGTVLVQVLRQTVVVSLIGIVIGVTVVLLTTKYLTTLLSGLSPLPCGLRRTSRMAFGLRRD